MAAELGPLSLNQLQKPAQKQQQLSRGTWQWGGNRWEEDDSWEVKAFAEDTGSALGTTWPPRSYTCAFCRREFRSAQALGGHMNVHRRDRARLCQSPQRPPPSPSSITPSPPIVSSSTEFVANARLCLFYPVPPHGTIFAPYPRNELISPPTTLSFPSMALADASPSQSNNLGLQERGGGIKDDKEDTVVEELDLELRLGRIERARSATRAGKYSWYIKCNRAGKTKAKQV